MRVAACRDNAAALGRSISLQERLTLQEALNADNLEGFVRFAAVVLMLTLAIEVAGAVILSVRWWSDFGPTAVWYGLFHSVSAFNNAGFALWSDNLMMARRPDGESCRHRAHHLGRFGILRADGLADRSNRNRVHYQRAQFVG